jgi:hypothetical protein
MGPLGQLLRLQWLRLRRRDLFRLTGGAVVAGTTLARGADDQGERPAGSEIWVGFYRDKTVWGCVNKHSVVPGEKFELMLSTGPARDDVKGYVEFFRVEPRSVSGGHRLVWRSPILQVSRQSVLRTAAATGVHWPPALSDFDTVDWPPGYYSIDFVEDVSGVRDLHIAQIIVRNPRRSGAMLFKLGTNTYQAYNAWGGHSLYPTEADSRGAMVSFDRPTGPAFLEYDVYLARWLEDLGNRDGFVIDYASNFDVHEDAGLVENYALVATGAHDEYWTKEEFDAFERRIFHHGKNTIFFGANTAYFQVRYADVNRPPGDAHLGRQMVCYKSSDDPIARRNTSVDPQLLVTARFRDNARRPETMMVGVGYQDWFPADAGPVTYYVESTDAPFFEGTGYRRGDAAADVVGYEWDNRDPMEDGQRLWDKDRSRIGVLEFDRIKVLFSGSATGEKTSSGRAEAVYFESSVGARVFSTGTIRWSWGLGKPGFEREPFRRFNENLVKSFLHSRA